MTASSIRKEAERRARLAIQIAARLMPDGVPEDVVESAALALMACDPFDLERLVEMSSPEEMRELPDRDRLRGQSRAIADALGKKPLLLFHVLSMLHQRKQLRVVGPWVNRMTGGWQRLAPDGSAVAHVRRLDNGRWLYSTGNADPNRAGLCDSPGDAAYAAHRQLEEDGWTLVPSEPWRTEP